MKQGMKNIFPTFLSLGILLVFEILNNVDVIKINLKIDLQTISNILILIISTYSIWCITVKMKQYHNHLEVYYLNNFLNGLSAFVLNINIFENKIVRFSDFFTGWHTLWSIWLIVLFLWFSGIGKNIYKMFKSMFGYVIGGVKCFSGWVLDAIGNTHKGVIFAIGFGVILWFASFIIINKGRSEVSIELIFKESLIFWCGWFIICMLIFFFANFSTKIGQAVKDMKNANVMKFFLWAVIAVVVLFVVLQVFPYMFPVLGNMLSFPIIISLLTVMVVYVGKEKLDEIIMVNWKDVVVVCGIVILVTFIFLPTLGVASDEGQSILASKSVEDFKTFMELITVGIGLIKEFLYL